MARPCGALGGRYEGFWHNGKQHGEGRYHHLDPIWGGDFLETGGSRFNESTRTGWWFQTWLLFSIIYGIRLWFKRDS